VDLSLGIHFIKNSNAGVYSTLIIPSFRLKFENI